MSQFKPKALNHVADWQLEKKSIAAIQQLSEEHASPSQLNSLSWCHVKHAPLQAESVVVPEHLSQLDDNHCKGR